MIAKRLISLGLAMMLALPLNIVSARHTIEIENPIENILSEYELFVSDDIIFRNHLMGAFFAGGSLDADWSSMGDSAIVDCYAGHLLSNVNFGTGTHLLKDGTMGLTSANLIYNTCNFEIYNDKIIQQDNYADVNEIFSKIRIESNGLISNPIEEQEIYNIDCTQDNDVYITIKDEDFSKSYNFIVNDIDWFKEHICVVTIIGINDSYIATSVYNERYNILLNGSKISLKDMSGAKEGGQINYDGMNLIWNFPDSSKTIDINGGWFGHLVAPNTIVKYSSWGNFEGGVIAKSFISGGCEGHFYPMSLLIDNKDKEEETSTLVEEETTVSKETTMEEETEEETTLPEETTTEEEESNTIEETTTIQDTTVIEEISSIESTEETNTLETTEIVAEITTEETTTDVIIETETIIEETATETIIETNTEENIEEVETTIKEAETSTESMTEVETETTQIETSTEIIIEIITETEVEESSSVVKETETSSIETEEDPEEKDTTEVDESSLEPSASSTSIAPTEDNDSVDRTIENIETTIETIPEVTVEMAVEPSSVEPTQTENSDRRKPTGLILGDAANTGSLPITGKLQWPITLFSISGLILVICGLVENKKKVNKK